MRQTYGFAAHQTPQYLRFRDIYQSDSRVVNPSQIRIEISISQTQTTHSNRIHLGLAVRGLQSRNCVGVARQNSKCRPRLAIRLMLGNRVLRGPRRLPVDRRQAAATWFFWHGSCNRIAVSRAHSGEYVDQIAKGGALRANITRRSDRTSKSSKATCSGQRALPDSRRPPMPGVVKDRRACRSVAAESVDAGQPQPPQPDRTLSGGTKAPIDGG